MICKICGKEFNAANHIKKIHNITSKEYYDTYIKQGNDGKCKVCGKSTMFMGIKIGYKSYCSVKCAQNDPEVRKQVTETTKSNLKAKYGVENVQQISEVREKTKQTCKKRYGTEYAIAAKSTREKISVIQKSKRRDYSDLIKTDDLCNKYGTGWYQVRDSLGIETVMMGRYGYIKKSDIPKIENYLHSDLRHSKAETELLTYVQSFYDKEILHNKKRAIYPYELDLYFPDIKIGVEYNSKYYHSIEYGTPKDYHLMKSLLCRDKGIRLIHIYEFEDFEKQKQLLKDLILGQDNYPKEDFNKNNSIKNVPEPTIIYQNDYTIYGAGPLY